MNEFYPAGLPTPRPLIDPDTEPYWDAAERGELVVPHCSACDRTFWYPRGFCPRCGGADLEWRLASGLGEIYSYSIVRRASNPWDSHTPFVLAYVVLTEGITVQANVVDCSSDLLVPGLRVRAVFERNESEDLPILRFTPMKREG